jgi:phosphoglycerate dehydrogenase-like enzyme
VYGTELLPADSSLHYARCAVLTPHPGYVTTRTMTHWYAEAIEDIEAWQRGVPIWVLTPG